MELAGTIPPPSRLNQEELGLYAEVELQAELGQAVGLPAQDGTAVHRVGLAVEVQLPGRPGHGRLPRELGDRVEVRPYRQLVVGRALAETVDGGTGEQLRAAHHLREVVDGHSLGLGHAMDVHVGG